MSDSLLSSDKDDISSINTSSNPIHSSNERNKQEEEKHEEQINNLSELSLTENDSFFTILKRLCFYWRRIVAHKIRVIFTLIFMSMLNITARITCFARQRTPPSSSSFTTTLSSSSIRPLEEDLNDSSKSPLLIDKQQIDLPSLHNSKMANILVQQQTLRTPNININRSTTSQKDTSGLMRHSVDDRLFFHDSTRLINLLTRFASEPQISKYHIQSPNTNGQFNKSLRDFTLSLPISNSCFKLNEPEKDEIDFDDILMFNCDKIQPVSTSTTENFTSDQIDNISSSTTTHYLLEEIITINDELTSSQLNNDLKTPQLNDDLNTPQVNDDPISPQINDDLINPPLHEDILLETNSSTNDNDTHCERHFRRRKRRSSLTKTSISLDDTQAITNLFEKVDINKESTQDNNENIKLKENEDKPNTKPIEIKISEYQESDQTIDDLEKSASLSRYRGRRLRHRFYRHAAASSSLKEVTSNISSELYLPNETCNVETPTTPTQLSSLSVIMSPNLLTQKVTQNVSMGGLKRVGSIGSTKKTVHFADSVGLELAHVQYIQSSINDDSKELSFLLSTSFLSSSPPSFTKNNLYLPNTSNVEHKPWSFDVMLKPKKPTNDKVYLKRFFCLFRQPDSEHPDIFLHEIWKSQIKLEHADIPFQSSSIGEQQLIGTLWVTNISFSKYVSIKYTFNQWINTYESEAQHCRYSNDFRNIDQFQFIVNIPKDVDRIDFVLRYSVNGQEFWDNNGGKNYTLQNELAHTASTTISLPHDCDFNEMRFY
ncbi:unnamed protein product [Rotaria sp. Silwood2]|nr:unnamed protein product [Rotaria sp. Silwood2]CAF3887906.1 unnamed protein product [Rotaria sp. Silwood2]